MFKTQETQAGEAGITHPVRDRSRWVLRLLWAPDESGNHDIPIYGKTRLMKLTFLLDRKLAEEFDTETGFSFGPDKYGPFDSGVYDATTLLENEGLILTREPDAHDGPYETIQYTLTDAGADRAADLYSTLPDGQQELVRWIKQKYGFQTLGRLLTYVYNQYPSMTSESVLK